MLKSEAVCFSNKVLTCHHAFVIKVRADKACGKAFLLSAYVSVNKDNGNACVLCFGKHIVPPLFDYGRERYNINLVRNKPSDSGDLVFLLLIGIFKHQVNAVVCRLIFNILRIADSPSALRTDLRKA